MAAQLVVLAVDEPERQSDAGDRRGEVERREAAQGDVLRVERVAARAEVLAGLRGIVASSTRSESQRPRSGSESIARASQR